MKQNNTFKDYLLKLVDDALPDNKKKKKKGKDKDDNSVDVDLIPLGILKYLQLANAGN